jgi:S1-C subfamily serine protease
MAIEICCPHCDTTVHVADTTRGDTVRCKSCRRTFVAREARPAREDAERSSRGEDRLQSTPRPLTPPLSGTRDEEDRRPGARERRRRDEEDGEAPRSRRRHRMDTPSNGASLALIIGGVMAAGLVMIGGIVALVVVVFTSGSPSVTNPGSETTVAAGPGPAADGPAAGGPAAPPPGPAVPAPGAGRALRYRWQGGPHVYSIRVEVEKEDATEIHSGNCVIRANRGDRRPAGPAEARKGTGTGFVINANGYLITCAHVVADAVKIEVALGGRNYAGKVVALDHSNDLAVVQINGQNLPTIPLDNSDAAELGLEVRALGFPLSSILGDNLKVTRGTISGINKRNGLKVFQIDAPVNPGNSGGPVVTESGDVIGVTSAKLSGDGVSNIGFAVPGNAAKRLLTGKGIAFDVNVGNARLNGPALVKRLSPSVALITVTMGQNADADTYRLNCSGHLTGQVRPRGAAFMLPMVPKLFFPRFGPAGSQIDMDASGRVTNASGGTHLPGLLGDMGLYLINPLPPDDRLTWENSVEWVIERSNGGGLGPFGPRFGPFGPRFGPGMPGMPRMPGMPGMPGFGPPGQRGETTKAKDRSIFTRGAVVGDTLTIHKRYELKTDPTAGAVSALSLSGEGTIRFDTKDGMPRDIEFKGTFQETSNAGNRREPIVVSYKLLEGTERDRILNPPPPPKEEPKVLNDADLTKAIADLQSTDRNRQRAALGQLAKAKPTARRDEVARALEPILKIDDFFTRKSCLEAIAVWGTKENVPSLIPFVANSNLFLRHAAMTALANLKDERGIEPIARRLIDFSDRAQVSKSLQAFGSKAEKELLKYLKHDDWGIRLEVCRILKVIGSRQSKEALEQATGDSNPLVAHEAKQAVAEIAARP